MNHRGKSAGFKGKIAVMGLLERKASGESRVRTRVIVNKRSQLQPAIRESVTEGANVYTDARMSYQGLEADYDHNVIDRAIMYAEVNVHTNGLENFWSLLKRAIHGTYVSIEPFHLVRYLDEQSFRFNNRTMTDASRFALALKGIIHKRLTYTALTGSELPQTC